MPASSLSHSLFSSESETMTMNQAMNSLTDNSNNLSNSPVTSRPRPVTPNPLLSSSLPSERTSQHIMNRHLLSKRRPHAQDRALLSASIPMPKSHVHRTPSELQLADDMRRAEYEDVRMYARLVVGMQSQCMVSGYVHPLTKKSLQDILKTKQASQGTLNKLNHKDGLNSKPKLGVHQENHNEDWADLVEPTVAEAQDEASVDTPQPVQPMEM
eukprot:342714_1